MWVFCCFIYSNVVYLLVYYTGVLFYFLVEANILGLKVYIMNLLPDGFCAAVHECLTVPHLFSLLVEWQQQQQPFYGPLSFATVGSNW